MKRKVAYKVFRVINEELYSAWENGKKRLHYRVGKSQRDPKPDSYCLGLAILTNKAKALKNLKACHPLSPKYSFALYTVRPIGKIGQEYFGKDGFYGEAEVDELIPVEVVRDGHK